MKKIGKIVKVTLVLGLIVYICMGSTINVNASTYNEYISSSSTSGNYSNLIDGNEESSNINDFPDEKHRNDPLQNLIGIITLAGICGFIIMGFYDDNH